MFKYISKLINKFFSKRTKLTLQGAIDLKKQFKIEIDDIENKLNNLILNENSNKKDENYNLFISLLQLLEKKEIAYGELSNSILRTNVRCNNIDNIKNRETLVRKRNILKKFPETIKLPSSFKKSILKTEVARLNKEIDKMNQLLEDVNKKTYIDS